MLNEKPHLIKKYMPYESYKILIEELNAGRIADYSLLDRAIVAHLRTITPEQLKKAPDVSEGIENRIILAANKFSTVEEIVEAVKSKRYTYARLKRIILASFLGVTSGLRQRKVPYIRVLGMNEKGAEILSLAKSKSSLFVVGSLKDAERIDDNTAIYTTLEAKATDIYSLALPKPNVGKIDYTTKFYKTF
jgi:predicted nucleotidyltransferase